ncbi:hypothetical protein [Calothrix sp. NIES-2098]
MLYSHAIRHKPTAVAHGGNHQDRAASPRRWLLKLLTGETQCRN